VVRVVEVFYRDPEVEGELSFWGGALGGEHHECDGLRGGESGGVRYHLVERSADELTGNRDVAAERAADLWRERRDEGQCPEFVH
jgi:hypothetical protein